MRSRILKLAAIVLVVLLGAAPATLPTMTASVGTPAMASIGALTFSADGVLFAADPQNAEIHAFEMGKAGGSAGAADVDGIDQKIAALLGTAPAEVRVTDMVIHPRTRNAYLAVMRGQGAAAAPALLRVDGTGKIDLVALEQVTHTKVTLPNPPEVNPVNPRGPARPQSITDMSFVDGRLIVAGLSNEEFASKLRSIPYPFSTVEKETSVEIYHGNHGQFETRAPVFAFVPYTIDGVPHLIAGYTCTPLVKFPLASLKGTGKVVGTTIAELGNRNRPLDMVVYRKGGSDFILMANSSRGVMKIPTATFAAAAPITSRVADAETAGVPFEKIDTLKGVEQLDLLDDQRSLMLVRSEAGLALKAVALP
jgi:hypothetical protein